MNQAQSEYLQAGAVVGNYQILKVLGRGGMGAVYEARHSVLGKHFALKTLLSSFSADPISMQRFVQEGWAASRVEHECIVDVSDSGMHNGMAYLVMELVQGESLAARLHRERRMSVQLTADVFVPVCAALRAAHVAGVVHRDLKPENILLTSNRRTGLLPKIVDFGISKVLSGTYDRALTQAGLMVGTPQYMAPELARGQSDVDPRVDQFALGAIIYECITGTMLFDGENLLAIIQSVLNKPIPSLRIAHPEVPAPFDQAVQRSIARVREERFPDAASMGRALLPYASPAVQEYWRPEIGDPIRTDVATPIEVRSPNLSPSATPSMEQYETLRSAGAASSGIASSPGPHASDSRPVSLIQDPSIPTPVPQSMPGVLPVHSSTPGSSMGSMPPRIETLAHGVSAQAIASPAAVVITSNPAPGPLPSHTIALMGGSAPSIAPIAPIASIPPIAPIPPIPQAAPPPPPAPPSHVNMPTEPPGPRLASVPPPAGSAPAMMPVAPPPLGPASATITFAPIAPLMPMVPTPVEIPLEIDLAPDALEREIDVILGAYSSGLQTVRQLDARAIQVLVTAKLAEADESHNGAPTPRKLFAFLSRWTRARAFGYVSSRTREDRKLQIEGVECAVTDFPENERSLLRSAFNTLCEGAREQYDDENGLYASWS